MANKGLKVRFIFGLGLIVLTALFILSAWHIKADASLLRQDPCEYINQYYPDISCCHNSCICINENWQPTQTEMNLTQLEELMNG